MVTTADALDIDTLDSRDEFLTGGGAWRAVIDAVLQEAADALWDGTVPSIGAPTSLERPMLAGVSVHLPSDALARVKRRWLGAARRVGAGTPAWELDDQHMANLFEASLNGDQAAIEAVAGPSGVDAEVVESFGYLLPVPFLQACQRHLASLVTTTWSKGYCPICGSWPAFAEVLGVERTRHLRCGRCGAAWHAQPVSCSFCGTTDHKDLVTLVPRGHSANTGDDHHSEEANPATGGLAVEACTRCSHYVKRTAALEACSALHVMLHDLESVALDFAAIDEGYARPRGIGYPLQVRLCHAGSGA